MMSLLDLNRGTPEDFVAGLDGIFEHSPWVARGTAAGRPFSSRLELLEALRGTVERASEAEQLALIRAHPQLGIRGRAAAPLTAASAREQRRAGLDACTAADLARLEELNAAYVTKFAMPFILAVRGHDPASIIASCQRRLAHEGLTECRTALEEIGKIAGFRLAEAVATPSGAEFDAMLERVASLGDQGTAIHALTREWMLAANLDVVEDRGELMGRRRTDLSEAATLLIGVHHSAADGRLAYEGLGSSLLGIAVAQRLRQQGAMLPFDLLIVVRTAARVAARSDGNSPFMNLAPWLKTPLVPAAGYGRATFARLEPRAAALEARSAEARARELEDFLLHDAPPLDYEGRQHG